jgi:hypothetical protein
MLHKFCEICGPHKGFLWSYYLLIIPIGLHWTLFTFPRISVGPLVYIMRTFIKLVQFTFECEGSIYLRNIGNAAHFHIPNSPKSGGNTEFDPDPR